MVATYITTAAIALAGATGVSVAFATFAISFALSMVVSRVFGQDQQGPQDSGTREQVPPSNVNAIPIVYGDAYLGGTFVDAVLTTDQKTMYYVLAVSCVSPNGQFSFDTTKMYYGDRLITFDGTDQTKVASLTDEAGNVQTTIAGNLYINLYISDAAGNITSTNGAALPTTVMGGVDIPVDLRWVSTTPAPRKMNGLAFAIVKLNYNQEASTTNLSPITFYAKHYLYGTGVAKPGHVWYDYITNAQYGGAVDAAFVDSASGIALNTYSDELITFETFSGTPSTQARYRMNGVLDAGQTVLSNLDKIMTCCDSWMAYNAAQGQWSVVINKPESVSYAFDDDNIIGEIRVSATDITQSVNIIEAKFPDKGARDQANFVNIATPNALRYPNEPDNKYSVTYDMCNDSVQAQYLANRVLEQAREDLIVGFSTTYYGIQVDAGSVVSVTNSDYGWTNKLFRVVKVNEAALPDGSLGAKLEMSEYSAAVYDDLNVKQYKPVPNSGLASPTYFSALTAPTVVGYPSATPAYFDVTIAIPATGRVTNAQLFFTTNPTPTAADWSLLASAASSNTQPITNGSSYVFTNVMLSANTYYFAFNVSNDVGKTVLSPISTAFVWAPTANPSLLVDISGVTSFTKTSANVYTPATATLTAITQNVTAPTYAWAITGATPATGTASSITITPTAAATSVVAQLTVNGTNLTSPVVKSVTMAVNIQADKYATAYLYQWSTATPGNPSGTSTYTWATGASSAYTGGNGWLVAPGSNPGTPLVRLYVASKEVVDVSTDATTSVSWTSGFSITDGSQNGANGIQTAEAIVYRWALTAPTITGTSTYTWATGAVSTPPTGWFTTISNTGTANQTLWAAKVSLTDSVVNATTTVNWSTASIVPFGYVGTTGASARTAYTATTLTLNTTPVSYTIAGDNVPATGTWGTGVVWSRTVPTLTAGQSVWQTDGVYNPTNNQTIYEAPYLSSLKVGNLAAISTNTGNLTVSGNFQSNNAVISGTTMTGSGGILYPTGSFAFGNSTTNITYNGSVLTMNGPVVAIDSLKSNTSGTFNTSGSFGLGVGSSVGGYQAAGAFSSSSSTLGALVSANTGGGNTISAGTTANVCSFTGSISGTTLTVTAIASGAITINSTVTGASTTTCAVTAFGTGTGGTGTYVVNVSQTSPSNAKTAISFGSSIVGVGGGNSTFVTYQNQGNLGTAAAAGVFTTAGAGSLAGPSAIPPTAEIRLAYYNGTTSYAYYVVSGAAFPFTAGHDALQLLTEAVPQIGDLMVDVNLIAAPNVNDCITQMTLSSSANQNGVVGVFVGTAGLEFVPAALGMYSENTDGTKTLFVMKPEFVDIYETYRPIGINSIGEGKMNVCGQGGDIAIGDLICASNMPGKGMKQADDLYHSYTVGKSRQAVTFSSPDEVVQIACIYVSG